MSWRKTVILGILLLTSVGLACDDPDEIRRRGPVYRYDAVHNIGCYGLQHPVCFQGLPNAAEEANWQLKPP